MKKAFALTLLLVFLTAPLALALTYEAETIGTAPNTISTLSNKVRLGVLASTTSFAAQTAHSSGSKMFGTASNSTKILWTTYVENAAVAAPTASDSSEFSSWTSL